MTTRRTFFGLALGGLALVALVASPADAARRFRQPPPPAAGGPASPSDAPVAPGPEAPTAPPPATANGGAIILPSECCDGIPPCCDERCIKYRHRRSRCCTVSSCETMTVCLRVKDPCCCCYIDVPVCVPACCLDAPCVSSRCGLFGRTIVTYTWACGYRADVVLTKRGDVLVTTFG